MFFDRAIVSFNAGRGGDGCLSFRREKNISRGGPDGGNGGDGGSIILVSQTSKKSLIYFKYQDIIKAANGSNGSGSNKTGKKGQDKVIQVPPGTVVKSYPDERLICDFHSAKLELNIAQGGKGGRGNASFKSSINRAPRKVERGKTGESIKVILELKLLAFAGIVGLPNAGKSTLISKISDAKPRIADYPFTTLIPNLGVVYKNYDSLVVADIPGIIAGSHKGQGMGLDFLKHIERNKVLIFLIDLSPQANFSPMETFDILRNELRSYKAQLLNKKFFITGNKIDILNGRRKPEIDKLKKYSQENDIAYLEISALKELNLNDFREKLFDFYYES